MTCARWALALPLVLGGCDLFEKTKDAVEGVTSLQVAVGLVVAASAPDSRFGDEIEGLGVTEGVGGTVFLADARQVADVENAPVSGAEVALVGCGGEAALEAQGPGAYVLVPPSDVDGCAELVIERRDDKPATLPVPLPPPFQATVGPRHDAGVDLVVDLSADAPDVAFGVLLDATSGTVLWSNEPEGVGEVLAWLNGNQKPSEIVVPGEHFEAGGAYALVLTQAVRTRGVDLDGVNTAISRVAAGRAVPFPIVVLDGDTDTDVPWSLPE